METTMGWMDAAALLDRVAREEMEELDRPAAFREPAEQQRDSIERSWGRSARQRARRRAEVAAVREAGTVLVGSMPGGPSTAVEQLPPSQTFTSKVSDWLRWSKCGARV